MAEGICYVCTRPYTAPTRDAAVDKIVNHIMTRHLAQVKSDTLETKNKFEKCPVCGAPIGKPLLKCPTCGADLVEQFARKVTRGYITG
ncbi:MAG: hypothetical protein EFT35_05810 [Methanophagales archaeon ANME-1-THS]|nr:MAG: hypothetical protein EFT35_05810 [Methanophagales archaeon ANME-1-THS]